MTDHALTPEAVADLALAAVDAAARPEAWIHLCDLVADRIRAAAFMVIAQDLIGGAKPMMVVSTVSDGPGLAKILGEAERGEDVEERRNYEAVAQPPPGHVLAERDVYGLSAGAPLPPNAWRDRVLHLTGGKDRSAMRLNEYGPFVDCAISHDGMANASSPPMTAIAPFLFPLLARTLESSRVVAALAASHARLMTLFDRLDFGAAFCTPDGRVLTANAAFRCIAADRDGLWEASGVVGADDPVALVALREALAAAVRPDASPGKLTLMLPRRSGRLPLVVRAAPVRERDLGPASAVLLVVLDPEDGERIDASGLSAFGVLSPAEVEVCDLLVRGFETPGIAERRGTGIETARDQIKSAAAKLACRSRLDLVRLAMAARVPVRET